MRFTWQEHEHEGLSGLTATPGEYDGIPPVDSLLIGSAPERVEPNLLAISAALAFEAYIADEISIEGRIVPLVADAITEFFAPRRVRTPAIEYKPRRLTEGQGVMQLRPYGTTWSIEPEQYLPLGTFDVFLTETYESPRGYARGSTVILPSNANLISPRPQEDARSVYPHLAAALLIAGELGIREIKWQNSPYSRDDPGLVAARRLLQSTNRELSWS